MARHKATRTPRQNSNGRSTEQPRKRLPSVPQLSPPTRMTYTAAGATMQRYSFGTDSWITERSGSAAPGGSTDVNIEAELPRLRENSRYMYFRNAIYRGLINRIGDFYIGDGPTLQAMTDDPARNEAIELAWRTFWHRPEVRQIDHGSQVVRLWHTHLMVDGAVLTVLVDDPERMIEILPASRLASRYIKSPRAGNIVRGGVEMDRLGKIVGYWIDSYGQTGYPTGSATFYPAESVIYTAWRSLADQTLGEPPLQTALPMLHRLNDVCDSEAAAWQLLSRFAVAIKREGAATAAFTTSEQDSAASDRSISPRIHDIGMGIIAHLEPGEEVQAIGHDVPGANFESSVKMFLRMIGMPIGLSLEFLLMIWSDTNYSSGRASIKQVERSVRPFVCLCSDWLTRVLLFVLADQGPAAELTHDEIEWHFPPYPFIDPEKEVAAAQVAVDSGLTSMTREAKSMAREYTDLVAEQETDTARLAEALLALKARFPDLRFGVEGGRIAIVAGPGAPTTVPVVIPPPMPDDDDETQPAEPSIAPQP